MAWIRRGISVGMIFGVLGAGCSSRHMPVCAPTPHAHVAVHSSTHQLVLCERGQPLRSYDVRLARNGVGKRREADGKLPLGRYSLGTAVWSTRFGLFLPVGYPTAEQRAHGFTGGAIGVHGPARAVRWMGPLVNAFDTTEGCIGLATDEEVRTISDFVGRRGATSILID